MEAVSTITAHKNSHPQISKSFKLSNVFVSKQIFITLQGLDINILIRSILESRGFAVRRRCFGADEVAELLKSVASLLDGLIISTTTIIKQIENQPQIGEPLLDAGSQ